MLEDRQAPYAHREPHIEARRCGAVADAIKGISLFDPAYASTPRQESTPEPDALPALCNRRAQG
jgi:hypothetical protein